MDICLLQKEDESEATKKRKVIVANQMITIATLTVWWYEKHIVKEPKFDLKIAREIYLRRLYYGSNRVCKNQLRLSKNCFTILCANLKEHGGLRDSIHVTVEEAVAMFLYVLAFNLNNRKISFEFIRSGETVSRYFNIVLRAILKIGRQYVIQPKTEMEGFDDEKWDWFQNCLGALDGTHIKVSVPLSDQGKYRNRKNEITTNVLVVCGRDLKFTYVLPGWEGSAADSKVLRDALVRQNPLIVPKEKYFLVDAGYTNGPCFLVPYRGVRYHLNEWSARGNNPQTAKELFNLRHSVDRNVIERAFGLLKKRWKILRNDSSFDVKTHINIINACVILHNLIRVEEPNDPLLDEVDTIVQQNRDGDDEDEEYQLNTQYGLNNEQDDRISIVQSIDDWTRFRDTLAQAMFIDYQRRRGGRI